MPGGNHSGAQFARIVSGLNMTGQVQNAYLEHLTGKSTENTLTERSAHHQIKRTIPKEQQPILRKQVAANANAAIGHMEIAAEGAIDYGGFPEQRSSSVSATHPMDASQKAGSLVARNRSLSDYLRSFPPLHE